MLVVAKRLIPCGIKELLAVQVVAKSTTSNVLKRESDCQAICSRGVVVLLLVCGNAFDVCLVAVDNYSSTTSKGVARVNS